MDEKKYFTMYAVSVKDLTVLSQKLCHVDVHW